MSSNDILEILIKNKDNLPKEDYEKLYEHIDKKEEYKYFTIKYNEYIANIINNQKTLKLLFKNYIIKLPICDDYSLKFLELIILYQIFENLPYRSYKDIIRSYGTKLVAYQKLKEHLDGNYDFYIEKFEDECDSIQEKILAYYILDKHILKFNEIYIDEDNNIISDSESDSDNSKIDYDYGYKSDNEYDKTIIDIDKCIEYLTDGMYP